jgi:hypothetical protein
MGEVEVGQGLIKITKPFSPTFIILMCWVFQPWEMIGSILFFLAALIALLGGIYFSHVKRTEQALVNEAERIKQILSRQRHDWMNHVQVLMGYQSMKKTERIQSYLQKLVHEATKERTISEIRYPPLAVALLTLSYRYQQWDWNVKVESKFQLPNQEDEQHLLRIVA